MFIGNFDPIALVFNIMNVLLTRGVLTEMEAKDIIRKSLPPNMTPEQKEELITKLWIPETPSNSASNNPPANV